MNLSLSRTPGGGALYTGAGDGIGMAGGGIGFPGVGDIGGIPGGVGTIGGTPGGVGGDPTIAGGGGGGGNDGLSPV